MTPRPIRSSGRRAIPGRIPTIASAAATTCSRIASWRSIPATGKLKWYYQFTPHDTHDWDANEPNVLVNTKFRGQDRKLLLHADRNGFFYVFDRTDGQLLLAEKFIAADDVGERHRRRWPSRCVAGERRELPGPRDELEWQQRSAR